MSGWAISLPGPYRHNLTARCWLSAEPSPCVHDLTPLVERVTAAIRQLGLIAGSVGQALFDHFPSETGSLAGPIAKRRAKAM
jgi:hypothetical protein